MEPEISAVCHVSNMSTGSVTQPVMAEKTLGFGKRDDFNIKTSADNSSARENHPIINSVKTGQTGTLQPRVFVINAINNNHKPSSLLDAPASTTCASSTTSSTFTPGQSFTLSVMRAVCNGSDKSNQPNQSQTGRPKPVLTLQLKGAVGLTSTTTTSTVTPTTNTRHVDVYSILQPPPLSYPDPVDDRAGETSPQNVLPGELHIQIHIHLKVRFPQWILL